MYTGAEITKYIENFNYQIYVTDMEKSILTTVAKIAGAKHFEVERYYDLITRRVVHENRTSEEIINDVFGKIGIKVVDDNESNDDVSEVRTGQE